MSDSFESTICQSLQRPDDFLVFSAKISNENV